MIIKKLKKYNYNHILNVEFQKRSIFFIWLGGIPCKQWDTAQPYRGSQRLLGNRK